MNAADLNKALGLPASSGDAQARERIAELKRKADLYDKQPVGGDRITRAAAQWSSTGDELRKRASAAAAVPPHVEELIKAAESGDLVALTRLARMLPRQGPPPPIGGRPR